METICFDAGTQVVAGITTLITVASMAANFVKKDTVLGKVVHFLALNLRKK